MNLTENIRKADSNNVGTAENELWDQIYAYEIHQKNIG